MALRNSSVPGIGVYLVCPLSSAFFAAATIFSGVSKSGSPAPKPIILRPERFNSATLPVKTFVGEGLILDRRLASIVIVRKPFRGESTLAACIRQLEFGVNLSHIYNYEQIAVKPLAFS